MKKKRKSLTLKKNLIRDFILSIAKLQEVILSEPKTAFYRVFTFHRKYYTLILTLNYPVLNPYFYYSCRTSICSKRLLNSAYLIL